MGQESRNQGVDPFRDLIANFETVRIALKEAIRLWKQKCCIIYEKYGISYFVQLNLSRDGFIALVKF